MIEYPKIYGPFKRHVDGPERNKLIVGSWTRPEFGELAENEWTWTEKIDGTNIRIGWDGHKVEIGGRTDNAQIPADLVQYLLRVFTEELFEQAFGSDPAILFGEGCGAGIQKNGGDKYGQDKHFKLFDVKIGDYWLKQHDIVDVAAKFAIDFAPLMLTGTVSQAIEMVRKDNTSVFYDAQAEGLVGVPTLGLLDRGGRRIQMKVKAADFFATEAA